MDTPLTQEMMDGFAKGVVLADGQVMLPAEARPGKSGPCSAVVVLHQGVYHQIKRMFGVYGAGVRELRRVAIGNLWLEDVYKRQVHAAAPGEKHEPVDPDSGRGLSHHRRVGDSVGAVF